VNLSAHQVARDDLVDTVAGVLATTGFDPALLCLEITESAFVDAAEAVSALKSLGVKLGIDDFGTGYSSLSYLLRFPVDIVKIDRSFVQGLGNDRGSTAITRAVLSLASTFGLTAVAEGVETSKQVAHLTKLECRLAQGYYFARPQPAASTGELLRSGLRWVPVGAGASRRSGYRSPAARTN
jgi:EAL domain-containing protein (putative c-di-GMP-specific phosphodiesterase class I)